MRRTGPGFLLLDVGRGDAASAAGNAPRPKPPVLLEGLKTAGALGTLLDGGRCALKFTGPGWFLEGMASVSVACAGDAGPSGAVH
jgi:hypothetical protein